MCYYVVCCKMCDDNIIIDSVPVCNNLLCNSQWPEEKKQLKKIDYVFMQKNGFEAFIFESVANCILK